MRTLVASAVLLGAFGYVPAAIAADYVLDLTAQTGQPSAYVTGQESIDDPQQDTVVRVLEPRASSEKQGLIAVAVLNRSGAPLNFGPENVTIKLDDGTVVPMLTYDELIHRQKKRETWQRIGLALGAAGRGSQAGQAGYSYGSGNYSGQTYGTYGATPYSARTTGTVNTTIYNPAEAAAAQAQTNAQTQRDAATLAENQSAARNQIAQVMQTTTVGPGQVFSGVAQYDIPKSVRKSKQPVPIILEVRAGNETHVFRGTLSKR